MVETLMARALAIGGQWGEQAEPGSPVERTVRLNEQLRLHEMVDEQVQAACKRVAGLLGSLVSSHLQTGLVRTGTTLKDGTGVMRQQAELLIDALFEAAATRGRPAEALPVIEQGVARFLDFLDGELKRIIEKVKFELQDQNRAVRFTEAAQRVWAAERAGLLGKMEHHRAAFRAMPEPSPEPQAPATPATPGFTALALARQPATDCTVEEIVLAGQPVQRIQFGIARETGDDRAQAMNEADWRGVWAQLVVGIMNGRARPRTQAQWRDALADACARQDVTPAPAEMDECARLLWWTLVGSQHVLSTPGLAGQGMLSPSGLCEEARLQPGRAGARPHMTVGAAPQSGVEDGTGPGVLLGGNYSLAAPPLEIG